MPMILDLDGTWVQTEKLKALSYAQVAAGRCPYELRVEELVQAFRERVGRSRKEVAESLIARFDLE